MRSEHDDRREPLPAHVALTQRLARAALARDRALGWRLTEQPSRLRIITIDAMATALARQAPIASELGALPRFVDDADLLYAEAAREVLAAAPAGDPHWQTFLKWLDNDAMTATRLIAQMLVGARPMADPRVHRRPRSAARRRRARAAVGNQRGDPSSPRAHSGRARCDAAVACRQR